MPVHIYILYSLKSISYNVQDGVTIDWMHPFWVIAPR